MYIFLFIAPILCKIGFSQAFSTRGCFNPLLSTKLAYSTLSIDIMAKIALYPCFDEFDIYLITCLWITLAYSTFACVYIYWNGEMLPFRNTKKIPTDTNFTLTSIKYFIVGIIYLTCNIFIIFWGWNWSDIDEVQMEVAISVLISICYILLQAIELIRLDRIKMPALRSLMALESCNAPIVLLRSFQIDKTPFWSSYSFDEKMCKSLQLDKYPIISLADPEEILPSGGSIKIQAKDEHWKKVVIEVLKGCRAVILIEGKSEGLHWEIETLKECINPEQLYVITPSYNYRLLAWCLSDETGKGIIRNFEACLLFMLYPRKCNKILKSIWNDFVSLLQAKRYNIKTKYPGSSKLFYFNSKWEGYSDYKKYNNKKMLKQIIKNTEHFNNSQYDYTSLSKSIHDFEINSYMKPESAITYKILTKKLIHICFYILSALLIIALITWN